MANIFSKIQALGNGPICRRCNTEYFPGTAIINQEQGKGDFNGNDTGTLTRSGQAVLIDCYKCPKCGQSFINSSQEIISKTPKNP